MLNSNSMDLLRNALLYEGKLISSLRNTVYEIEKFGIFQDVVEKLQKIGADYQYHEEILNYWIQQINAGEEI